MWNILSRMFLPPLIPIGLILPQCSTSVILLVPPGSQPPPCTISLCPYWPFFLIYNPVPSAQPCSCPWIYSRLLSSLAPSAVPCLCPWINSLWIPKWEPIPSLCQWWSSSVLQAQRRRRLSRTVLRRTCRNSSLGIFFSHGGKWFTPLGFEKLERKSFKI